MVPKLQAVKVERMKNKSKGSHSCQTILRGNAEEKRGKKGALSRKKKGQKRGKKKGQIVFLDGQFIIFLFHISIYILK